VNHVLLADLPLADLQVPTDPEAVPATGVDAGVLPADMVDHLRVATVFPVAPTVTGGRPPLRVVGGGRCVWAAQRAGWAYPIRCVLRGPAPPGVPTLPLADARAVPAPAELVHSAAFHEVLDAAQQARVEGEVRALAERMAAAGVTGFSRVSQLRWARPDLLHFAAPSGAGDAATLGPAVWALFADLAASGIALRALDGRVLR
jgi:hypothetical protein